MNNLRNIRIPDDLWDAFGAKCSEAGRNRSEVIRGLILDYTQAGDLKCPDCGFTTKNTTMGAASLRRHQSKDHS